MGDDVGYALQDGHTFRPQNKEAPLTLEPRFIPLNHCFEEFEKVLSTCRPIEIVSIKKLEF